MNLISAFLDNGIKATDDVDTSKISAIKAGGSARIGIYPETPGSLIKAIKICKLLELKFKVIGGCTNTFFKDGEYNGAVIFTKGIDDSKICDGYISAECGCSLTKLLKAAAQKDMEISNGLFGIPGTLGGALRNNAGAFGTEICESFIEGLFLNTDTLEVLTLSGRELDFGYRSSLIMREPLILLRGKLKVTDKKRIFCFNEFEKYSQKRRASQPCQPSLGSFFKRSGGIIPAELIDRAGLKGYRVNDAAVSEKHAGFILNLRCATANDINRLACEIEEKIKDTYNVKLLREAELVE